MAIGPSALASSPPLSSRKHPWLVPKAHASVADPPAAPAAPPVMAIGSSNTKAPEKAQTRARDFRIGKGLIQGGERRRFAMAVPLRADFDAVGVRCWAKGKSKDGPQARRLLALAAIYEGASRTEALRRIGGVRLQIVRDWQCSSSTPMVRRV